MNYRDSHQHISALGHHIPPLDGVRGWAILLVIINHSIMLLPRPDALSFPVRKMLELLGMGWVGVDLFFVLSGFLITGILLRTKGESGYFVNFYARRALRIFPLYYLVITAYLFITPLLFTDFGQVYGETIGFGKYLYYIYAQNFMPGKFHVDSLPQLLLAPTWSLAVEEHFYLVWPAIVYFMYERRLLRLTVALIGVAVIVRILFGLWGYPFSSIVYVCTICRMDSILVGALVAIVLHCPEKRLLLERWKWRIAFGTLFVFLGGYLLAKIVGFSFFETVGYTAFALFCASLINLILFLPRRARFLRIFDNAWCRSFGKYSYSMYLFHTPVILAVRKGLFDGPADYPLLGALALFALSTLATFALSWVSWNIFEKQFLKQKRHFEGKGPPRLFGPRPVPATAGGVTGTETP